MGRPFSHERAKPHEAPSESRLVLADAYSKSVGWSRSTMHRYIKAFGFKPCWCGGRLFLQRAELRQWEDRVSSGFYGTKPSVGKPQKKEQMA